jgi:hypothetical protein
VNGKTASTFGESEATIHELPARAVLTFGNPISQDKSSSSIRRTKPES